MNINYVFLIFIFTMISCGPANKNGTAAKVEANVVAGSITIDKLQAQTIDDEILYLQNKIEKAGADTEKIDFKEQNSQMSSQNLDLGDERISVIDYIEFEMQVQMQQNKIAEALGKNYFLELRPEDIKSLSKLTFEEAKIIYQILTETFKFNDQLAMDLIYKIKNNRNGNYNTQDKIKKQVFSLEKIQNTQAKLLLELYGRNLITKLQLEAEKEKLLKTSDMYKLILEELNKVPDSEASDEVATSKV